MPSTITRRDLLQAGLPAALALASGRNALAALLRAADEPLPVRVITRGPKHHWFGYYDKLQFDPTGQYVLGMEVDFEHRSPRADDEIQIGMVDLAHGDRWLRLASSTAWGWQQGCMLQWIPGTESKIIFNDRQDGRYVSRVMDVATGKGRTIDHPIYTVSADGRTAVAADFRRINDVRPGYGYVGLADPVADELAPSASGIVAIDLASGKHRQIISIAQVAALGTIPNRQPGIKHYFNHLLFNPDGSRFVFLHRWRYPDGKRLTRMLTARPDGSEIRIVDDNGLTSHFIWRDPRHILAWSEQPSHGKAFYLFEDGGERRIELVGQGDLTRDGHCSYLPGSEWILNDTYPDADRNQIPHLYHVASRRRVELGRFRSPPEYTGEWRCDTHPRFSRDGRMVCIDSPHGDEGRQLHLIDISSISS